VGLVQSPHQSIPLHNKKSRPDESEQKMLESLIPTYNMVTGNYEISNARPVREPTTDKTEALTSRYHLPNR
jgi:hypothetical protein